MKRYFALFSSPFIWFIRRRFVLLSWGGLLVNGLHGQQASNPVISEFTLPVARSAPQKIVAGPDGNLWFSQEFNDQVGKITPGGTITEYPAGIAGAYYMTAGPGGNVWLTGLPSGEIASITPSGVFTQYQVSGAYGIALGPDGSLWFTSTYGFTQPYQQYVGKMDSTGKVTQFPIVPAGSVADPNPHGITAGPDGNLWFTENGGNKIGRMTTSGVLTEYPLPIANSQPESITTGPDGNLWFTELRGAIGRITTSGTITEYPTAPESQFMFIAAGSDGALWFTQGDHNEIGRITVTGQIAENVVPTAGSFPDGIAAGPDGNIWFVESSTNKIGKVVLSNPVPSGPVTVSASSLTFSATYLSAPPAGQTFTVSAPAPTSFTATVDSSSFLTAAGLLAISPSGILMTNQTITVSVNQGVFEPGSYSGSISIVAGGVTQTVQVTMNVTATTGGDVYANVSTIQPSCTIGSIDPCSTELDILSKNSSVQNNPFAITTTVTTPPGGHWLSLATPNGTVIPNGSTEVTNYTLEVMVNTAGPSAGLYRGIVTITPNNGAVLTIPVSATLVAPSTAPPVVQAVVNSASFLAGGVSPGEIITIYGSNLGPTTPVGILLDNSGKVATSYSGALVLINGTEAPQLYTSSMQINCVVPYEVAGANSLTIQVVYPTLPSNSYTVSPVATSPAIFTLNGLGTGAAAILNSTGAVNGPNSGAPAGSVVTIFLTGEGQTNPAGVTGAVTAVNTSTQGPLTPQPLSEPIVTIGGFPAQVSFYGEAPGLVSGVLQINAIVPSGLPSGALPLLVSIAGAKSQAGVTVNVQ